jgi:hypothetical protein
MAFDAPLTPRWRALLKNGGSLAAVVPAEDHRFTLIYRQPQSDHDAQETELEFRIRAAIHRKALAIITDDWRAVIEEWRHLQEAEQLLHDQLKQKTEALDGAILMMQAITNDQRSRYYEQLNKILDRLEALDSRLDSLEATQLPPPPPNYQGAIDGSGPGPQSRTDTEDHRGDV